MRKNYLKDYSEWLNIWTNKIRDVEGSIAYEEGKPEPNKQALEVLEKTRAHWYDKLNRSVEYYAQRIGLV